VSAEPEQPDWDDGQDQAELEKLREDPPGEYPAMPPEVRAYELPVWELPWATFESLCERLARHDGGAMGARRYGRGGQKQHGIDIYAVRPNGRYRVWQCKQYAAIKDLDVIAAATEFLAGPWAEKADNFTFCTSLLVADTTIEDDAVAARKLLAAHNPSIEFELWDGREISHLLENRPEEVYAFFGPDHYRRFIRPGSGDTNVAALSALSPFAAVGQPQTQVRIVSLPVEPAQVREALEQLRSDAPTELVTLLDLLGEPPRPGRAQRVIEDWPPFLDSCSESALSALALLAERDGAWSAASRAWEALGERAAAVDASAAAGLVTLAAVAAKIDADVIEYGRLIARARELDPNHPRLAVELLPADAPGATRIEALKDLQNEDPQVILLVKCNLALGYLLELDFTSAQQVLNSLSNGLAASVAARATKLNLVVHRARLAVLDQRPLDGAALTAARGDALALREQLLTQRRYEESARLLMLAADALMLLGDRGTAIRTLRGYRPEERDSETGAEVLAAVALRIGDWGTAVSIAEHATQSPSLERLRAAAIIESDQVSELPAALAILDDAVTSGGQDGAEAALFRLAATMREGVTVPWSDAAEQLVMTAGHERVAVVARAFFTVRHHADYEGAYELLDQHASEPWTMGPRLVLARRQGNWSVMKETARSILTTGASQDLRLQCAYVLLHAREVDEALAAATGVAREPSAPRLVRANAFEVAVRILGPIKGEWTRAKAMLEEWTQLVPGDTRASAFTPVAMRRAASRRSAEVHSRNAALGISPDSSGRELPR
jgi:hypothetical protein